jgi:hypothetical protein
LVRGAELAAFVVAAACNIHGNPGPGVEHHGDDDDSSDGGTAIADGGDNAGGEGEGAPDAGTPGDGCVLNANYHGALDGELDDAASTWTLQNATPIVYPPDTDHGVEFSSDVVCSLEPALLSQQVFIPEPCNGLTPAFHLRTTTAGNGTSGSLIFARIDGASQTPAGDDDLHCLGDRVFGRTVTFEGYVRNVTVDDAPCVAGDLATDVWNADVGAFACPAPGSVQPFSTWRVFPTAPASASTSGAGLDLSLNAGCGFAEASGDNSGAVSIPSAFAGPALHITGAFHSLGGAILTMHSDGYVLGAFHDLQDETVCLPHARAGDVMELYVTLAGGADSTCQSTIVESAHLDEIDLVDDPACDGVGALPDPSFANATTWFIDGGATMTAGALTMSAPNVCEGGDAETWLAVPAGSGHALSVTYALAGDHADTRVSLDGTPQLELPATTGDTMHVCLDPRWATEVRPLQIQLSEPQTQPGCDEVVESNELTMSRIDVVDDPSCP